MRRIGLILAAVSLIAILDLRGHAQTPSTTIAQAQPTPAIVQDQRTATPSASFCGRPPLMTPIPGFDPFAAVWSVVIDEVRIEDEATVQIDESVRVASPSQPDTDYVTVLLTATNISTDVQPFPPTFDLLLFDDKDRTHSPHGDLMAPWLLVLDGPLSDWEPGGTHRAATVFMVPIGGRPEGVVSTDGSFCIDFAEGTPTAR